MKQFILIGVALILSYILWRISTVKRPLILNIKEPSLGNNSVAISTPLSILLIPVYRIEVMPNRFNLKFYGLSLLGLLVSPTILNNLNFINSWALHRLNIKILLSDQGVKNFK